MTTPTSPSEFDKVYDSHPSGVYSSMQVEGSIARDDQPVLEFWHGGDGDPAGLSTTEANRLQADIRRWLTGLGVTLRDAATPALAETPDPRPWVSGPPVLGPATPDRPEGMDTKQLRCLACKTLNEVPVNEDTVICWACGKASQPEAGTLIAPPNLDDVPTEL